MDFSRMEEVRAGWSGDRKYHAWDSGGQEYFLRLSPPEKWEKAQRAFALQKKAFQLGLPVSEPLELTQEDGQVRFVERWLSGRMAEDALPALPQEEQYRLGREAGRVLRALPGRSRGLGEPVQQEAGPKDPCVSGMSFTVPKRRGVYPVYGGKPEAPSGAAPVRPTWRLPRGEYDALRGQAFRHRL